MEEAQEIEAVARQAAEKCRADAERLSKLATAAGLVAEGEGDARELLKDLAAYSASPSVGGYRLGHLAEDLARRLRAAE